MSELPQPISPAEAERQREYANLERTGISAIIAGAAFLPAEVILEFSPQAAAADISPVSADVVGGFLIVSTAAFLALAYNGTQAVRRGFRARRLERVAADTGIENQV